MVNTVFENFKPTPEQVEIAVKTSIAFQKRLGIIHPVHQGQEWAYSDTATTHTWERDDG